MRLDTSALASPSAAKRHLVWVTLDFYPDDQASSQLFTDLLLRLAGERLAITVFCGYPVRATKGRPGPVPRTETLGGITIKRCGFNVEEKHGLVNRALLYAAFLLHASWRLLRVDRTSMVFGVTSPPFIAQVLWLTSRLRHFSYGYMFLDIYPEALIALGRLKGDSPIARCWMGLNRLSYAAAHPLAVLGRDMIPLLARNYALDPERLTYIPLWSVAEPDRPLPFSENTLALRLGLADKFVVQYSGNMGLLHDIESLVHAAARLRDEPQIHFLFIGKGRRRQSAESFSTSLGLTNITWLDFVPREQLPETLTCCHAAIVSMRAGMEGVAVPSKLYGILAAGRAVIAQVPAGSEIAMVVEEEACGLVVPPGNIERLVDTIRTLAADRVAVDQMSARAHTAYRAKYTIDQAVLSFKRMWGFDTEGRGACQPIDNEHIVR
jgi:colanic acid biosynthesis glycosyl transferase WcaI